MTENGKRYRVLRDGIRQNGRPDPKVGDLIGLSDLAADHLTLEKFVEEAEVAQDTTAPRRHAAPLHTRRNQENAE